MLRFCDNSFPTSLLYSEQFFCLNLFNITVTDYSISATLNPSIFSQIAFVINMIEFKIKNIKILRLPKGAHKQENINYISCIWDEC